MQSCLQHSTSSCASVQQGHKSAALVSNRIQLDAKGTVDRRDIAVMIDTDHISASSESHHDDGA